VRGERERAKDGFLRGCESLEPETETRAKYLTTRRKGKGRAAKIRKGKCGERAVKEGTTAGPLNDCVSTGVCTRRGEKNSTKRPEGGKKSKGKEILGGERTVESAKRQKVRTEKPTDREINNN